MIEHIRQSVLETANQYAKRRLGEDWFVDVRPDWAAYGLHRRTGEHSAYMEYETQSMEALAAHIDMLSLTTPNQSEQ